MPENKISLKVDPTPAAPPAGSTAPASPVTKPITLSGPAVSSTTPVMTIPAAAKPAVPPAPAPAPAGGFQNIFSQQKTQTQGPKMIDSILAKKSAPQMKSILGKAPTLQKSLEQERDLQQKKKLQLVQIIFVTVFLSALATVGYFYAELSPSFDLFGPNTTARLTDVNRNLRSLQTQTNKYHYLMAQLDLNGFSLLADDFLDKTSLLSTGKVTLTTASLAQSTTDLPGYLTSIRENLMPDIVVPLHRSEAEPELTEDQIRLQFQDDLKKALSEDRSKIAASTDLTDVNKQELRLMDNAIKLVGNIKLLNSVKASSPETFQQALTDYVDTLDPLKRQEIQTLISTLLSSTKSEVSTIGYLKNSRVNWSSIIKNIEAVTITVDKNFGKGLTEAIGEGIIYTGYEFEANTNKIVLSGETLTSDAYNFTTITRLIDALEKDPHFKNVEMRSFAKSGTPEEGYTANFKIGLDIELNGDSPNNKPIALEKRTVAEAAGVKRKK